MYFFYLMKYVLHCKLLLHNMILPFESIKQVVPLDVLRAVGTLFSTERNTAIDKCCSWQDSLFDHASLLMFIKSSAPPSSFLFFTNCLHKFPNVSSKQIGVENFISLLLKT